MYNYSLSFPMPISVRNAPLLMTTRGLISNYCYFTVCDHKLVQFYIKLFGQKLKRWYCNLLLVDLNDFCINRKNVKYITTAFKWLKRSNVGYLEVQWTFFFWLIENWYSFPFHFEWQLNQPKKFKILFLNPNSPLENCRR